jgi:hypothetical protein
VEGRGYPVAAVAHEVTPGTIRQRPQLTAVIEHQLPSDVFLCYSLGWFNSSQSTESTTLTGCRTMT